MNTKSKVLIGLMAICLLGGVGSTLALTQNGASATGTPGAFDQAISLYWGSEETSISLDNVQNLQVGAPQYRYLSVTPKSTKSVAGNVTLSFTLAASAGEHHVQGLEISVYKTASLGTDETVAGLIDGVDAEPVLDADHLTGSTSFAVSAGENVHETEAFYAIKISWDGDYDHAEGHGEYTMSGLLTIAQSFAA